jgi:type IV pilus assembly protein PilC
MAEFTCRLGTPGGEIVTRTLEATAERELRSRLEREGFRVFAIDLHAEPGALVRRRTAGRVKIGDFLLFNQQLSALLRAGIPILKAVQILGKRQKSERLRIVLHDVEDRIKTGVPLSEAFAAQGETFPRIYVASVLAGERSGSLDEVLARYVSYTKGMAEITRKLKKSLTYPAVLIVAMIVLIGVLTTYVIPKFAQLYGKGRALPLITTIVVGISNTVRANLVFIIPAIVIGVVLLNLWRRSDAGRLTIDRWLLRMPIVGQLIRDMTVARFCRSMATLLAGGLTVPDSVEIASDSITNRELQNRSRDVLRKIREGRPVTDSLAEAGWLPELALDMIGVGESSGALQGMLDEVAGFYDAELDVRLSALTTIIEPVILVFMGSVVLVVLLAIYLPILQLAGNANRRQTP